MKKFGIIGVLAVMLLMSFTLITNKEYTTSVGDSSIEWKGYKPTGSHNGTIGITDGTLIVDGNSVVTGSFTINMKSITVLDSDSPKLLKHLKSNDFFDVEKFPTAEFKISGSRNVAGKMMVKGFLTVKGITEEIEFPATLSTNEKEQLVLESETFQIDRTKFNVTYKSKSFFTNLKDKFINDEFDIKIKVVSKGN